MKPLLSLILSLSFSFAAFGQQDSLGFTNKAEAKNLMVNGKKEGKWVEYFGHFMRYEGDVGNSMDSLITIADTSKYIDTGSSFFPYYTYQLTVYKNGEVYGVQRKYRRNGTLSDEIEYNDGEINGMEKGYYYNEKLASITIYLKGKRNGVATFFYLSGRIKTEVPWKNGRIDGTIKDYFESGKLKSEAKYNDGDENGLNKEYYESGKIKLEISYKHNAKNGIQKEYYESGKLKAETKYTDGDWIAVKNYDENGNEIKK